MIQNRIAELMGDRGVFHRRCRPRGGTTAAAVRGACEAFGRGNQRHSVSGAVGSGAQMYLSASSGTVWIVCRRVDRTRWTALVLRLNELHFVGHGARVGGVGGGRGRASPCGRARKGKASPCGRARKGRASPCGVYRELANPLVRRPLGAGGDRAAGVQRPRVLRRPKR